MPIEKHDPEADRRFRDFKEAVTRAERAGKATKYLIEEAGVIVAFLEFAWRPKPVLDEAQVWVDRALQLPAEID